MTELPLRGIRVLDVTVVWSGPSACRLLAALGAEVIRIESIRHFPTTNRGLVPYPDPDVVAADRGMMAAYPGKVPGPDPYNRFGPFLVANQGKLGCTMELDTPEGQRAFRRLAELSDVIVENNAWAVSEALGITWAELGPLNPRLVLVRMAPLGLTGPYRDVLGFGAHFEALVGITGLRGHAGAEPTDAGSTYHMDDVAPQGVVFGILAALRQREQTGRGQLIEFPQAEYLMQGLGDAFVASAMDGRQFTPQGNRHPAWVQGCYPCRGADQWIAISICDDQQWSALTAVLGPPGWADSPRFATALSRREHQDELDELLGASTSAWSKRALFLALQQAGVPAGPVNDEADAYADPQFEQRGVFRPVDHPSAGTHQYPTFGARWSGMQPDWGRPAPLVGQDNEYVYQQLLGYTSQEYDQLAEAGLIGTRYAR
ncbi:MAG TPA: CoA transferase [Streptosporangiaceae bacterium]|jgi:crotonobetainyl-CoA:carnitine CoA-transferase CaiB-like acyl-CoA transferase|nr:CoA transferase [Streptosporangiaceae bacterium]